MHTFLDNYEQGGKLLNSDKNPSIIIGDRIYFFKNQMSLSTSAFQI